MFKFAAVVIIAFIGCVAAKPGLIGTPLVYNAPVVAAPVVTARSSQVIARNYNGIATAPIVAPIITKTVAAYSAPVAATYNTPVIAKYAAAYSHPLAYSTPLSYSAPVVAKYTASPLAYSASLRYASPLSYAAAW